MGDSDTVNNASDDACFPRLWCNGKRGSVSMAQGKHFSTTTIADSIFASIEEKEGDLFSNFEDHLFDTLCDDKDVVSLSKFLADLNFMGLGIDDPRLRETMKKIKEIQLRYETENNDIMLDRETFCNCITDNIVLIKKAFEAEFIIPEFNKFCETIEGIYEDCKSITGGKVHASVPSSGESTEKHWGVSLCTVDGQRFSVGDVDVPFSLHSIFKPLIYALAMNELGPDIVHQYVGQEPSGEEFNVIKLDHNNQPHNPMITAGGMVMLSLIKRHLHIADKFDYINEQFKKLTGGEYVGFNNSLYLTERNCSNRNFALGYYLQENKCFPEGTSLKNTLDLYFQMCSIEASAESLAVVAATLANGGICPLTGEECLNGIAVQNVLSIMYSCGMYDYSGQFAFKVGLPAKGSISGGILLVIPNVMGLCIWAPPLDKYGNSQKGIHFCDELVRAFNFHQYDSLLNQVGKIDPRHHKNEITGTDVHEVILAAHSGNIEGLQRMFMLGLDMRSADYDGRTALHLACSEGQFECVKFLIEKCKVPVNAKDRWSNTPLDDCKAFKHDKVTEYLEKYITNHPDQD